MWNSVRHSIFFLKNEKKISWNCVEIIKSNEKYLLKLQIFHYGRKCYNSLQVSRIDNTHFFLKYIKTFRSQINNAYLKLKYLFLHSLVLQNLPLTNCFFSLTTGIVKKLLISIPSISLLSSQPLHEYNIVQDNFTTAQWHWLYTPHTCFFLFCFVFATASFKFK